MVGAGGASGTEDLLPCKGIKKKKNILVAVSCWSHNFPKVLTLRHFIDFSACLSDEFIEVLSLCWCESLRQNAGKFQFLILESKENSILSKTKNRCVAKQSELTMQSM